MELDIIRQRVNEGNYLIKSHAITHALKEGFERRHIVEAILEGAIIEEYSDDKRVLICGETSLSESSRIYLHVVCEYADAVYVEIVTAYVPDELAWESPPFRRRTRKKK